VCESAAKVTFVSRLDALNVDVQIFVVSTPHPDVCVEVNQLPASVTISGTAFLAGVAKISVCAAGVAGE